MHPWLLHTGSLQVPTYLTLITLGFCLAAMVVVRQARRSALDTVDVLDVALVVLPGAWVGARLFLVFEQPGVYLRDPLLLLSPAGGWVFYGGFLTAASLVLLRAWRKGLDPWAVGDVFAPALPFGIVFGRLGCLGAGCCHGRPADWPLGVEVPWSVLYTAHGRAPAELLGVPLHPSPLYESMLGLVLFVWLTRAAARATAEARPTGLVAARLFVGYGVGRFVLELFRGDLERGVALGGWLSSAQVTGLAAGSAGLALWAWRARRGRPTPPAPSP